MLVSIIIILLS